MTPCIDHGRTSSAGYATMRDPDGSRNQTVGLHVMALAAKLGVSRGYMKSYDVRHICDNRRCINPDHLELGSRADNIRDTIGKPGSRVKTRVLSADEVTALREDWKSPEETYKSLAVKYETTYAAVYGILRRGRRRLT